MSQYLYFLKKECQNTLDLSALSLKSRFILRKSGFLYFIFHVVTFLASHKALIPPTNFLAALVLGVCMFGQIPLFSQTTRFQSYYEVNVATKPINRHILEVSFDQGFSGDTALKFVGNPSSTGFNLWYYYFPTRTMKLNLGAYWNESFDREDLNQNPQSELRLSAGPSFNVPGRRILLNHRFMADYRMFFVPNNFQRNLRLRYRFQALSPITKRTLVKGALYFYAREEFFFAKKELTDGIQLLNMARTSFGLGFVFSDYMQFEAIYQYGIVPNRDDKALGYRDHFIGLNLQFNNLFLKHE